MSAARKTVCPRCQAHVAVKNGRYARHKYVVKGISCGMSREKVQENDEKPRPPAKPSFEETARQYQVVKWQQS